MYSVTKRISMIKQPRGGYINKKELVVTQLDDGITLNENENIHASLVGLAVDYMTRFLMGAQKEEAFSISLKGALALDLFTGNKKQSSMKNATSLLADIKGLDKKSITNACKLVGYDVCFRAGIIGYKPVEEINPDKDTISTTIQRETKLFLGADNEETAELTVPMYDFGDWASRMKAYRKKNHITQQELAQLMGVKHFTLRSWEQKQAKPPYNVWRLHKHLFDDSIKLT